MPDHAGAGETQEDETGSGYVTKRAKAAAKHKAEVAASSKFMAGVITGKDCKVIPADKSDLRWLFAGHMCTAEESSDGDTAAPCEKPRGPVPPAWPAPGTHPLYEQIVAMCEMFAHCRMSAAFLSWKRIALDRMQLRAAFFNVKLMALDRMQLRAAFLSFKLILPYKMRLRADAFGACRGRGRLHMCRSVLDAWSSLRYITVENKQTGAYMKIPKPPRRKLVTMNVEGVAELG
jgi:hypothetical protein